jgi:hypothetical protein
MRSDFSLDRGDVVQLSPEFKNVVFAGCMMTITEVKGKKITGYVTMIGQNGQRGGHAYLFATRDDIEFVGRANWMAE